MNKNEEKLWNGKLIGKLLLSVTIADPKQFTLQDNTVTHIEAFLEVYY